MRNIKSKRNIKYQKSKVEYALQKPDNYEEQERKYNKIKHHTKEKFKKYNNKFLAT